MNTAGNCGFFSLKNSHEKDFCRQHVCLIIVYTWKQGVQLQADPLVSSAKYNCTFFSNGVGNRIWFEVSDSVPITTRTYHSDGPRFAFPRPVEVMYYNGKTIYNAIPNDSSGFEISFTSVSDSLVSGTFSGTVEAQGYTPIRITDGEFFVGKINVIYH